MGLQYIGSVSGTYFVSPIKKFYSTFFLLTKFGPIIPKWPYDPNYKFKSRNLDKNKIGEGVLVISDGTWLGLYSFGILSILRLEFEILI